MPKTVMSSSLELFRPNQGEEQVEHHDDGSDRENHVFHVLHLLKEPDGAREEHEQKRAHENRGRRRRS